MMNDDIKAYARRHRVYLYEVGKALGYTRPTFSRRLHSRLSDDFKNEIFTTILKIESDRYEARQEITESNEVS